MKSLIHDLENVAGKTAYQTYTINHGIERLTALVPVKNSKAFEEAIHSLETGSKQELTEVISKHSGKIRG